MDIIRPEDRTRVTIRGKKWELIAPEKFDFDELRLLKRESGGFVLSTIGDGITAVDPDAWFGWFLVSFRRADPTLNADGLRELLKGVSFEELADALESDDSGGAAQPDPPSARPSSAGGSTPSATESGAPTQPGTILEMPGTPA